VISGGFVIVANHAAEAVALPVIEVVNGVTVINPGLKN